MKPFGEIRRQRPELECSSHGSRGKSFLEYSVQVTRAHEGALTLD